MSGYVIKEVVLLKDKNSFKTFLLFALCSASVLVSSLFLLKNSDKKNNVSPIIFNESDGSLSVHTTENVIITSSSARSATKSSRSDKTTADAQSSEKLYININTAGADELKKLSGIGEVLANEIITYRDNNGDFRNIEEIMLVKGIGDGIFNDIRDFIYVEDPVYDEEASSAVNEQEYVTEEYTEYENETEHILTLEEVSPININIADAETLMLLPHVNQEIAEKIIEFREHTEFSNEYELLLIDGLSQNEVSDMLDYITT